MGSWAHRLLRGILHGLAAVGLLFLTVTFTPLVVWWATLLAGPWHDPRGDVLIVPAGSSLVPGILGESSYWRSVYAVLAWREGSFREVILSGGGDGQGAEPVCETMRRFLEAHGVPSDRIRLERRARSTRESAVFTAALLADEPGLKVLLTSDYHMFRAARAFRSAGVDLSPRPFPDVRKRAGQWSARPTIFVELVEETVKIGYYAMRGWI